MNKDNAKYFLPLVKALADGKTIQKIDAFNRYEDKDEIEFTCAHDEYRIKPELEYPVTSFKDNQLEDIYTYNLDGFRAIANLAIKQAIIDGDVILPEKK